MDEKLQRYGDTTPDFMQGIGTPVSIGKKEDGEYVDAKEALDLIAEKDATIERLREDVEDAAGELMVDIPEPGTVEFKLLCANGTMRRERNEMREHYLAEQDKTEDTIARLRAAEKERNEASGELAERDVQIERLREVLQEIASTTCERLTQFNAPCSEHYGRVEDYCVYCLAASALEGGG